MKVVGKMGQQYMVSMSQDELLQMVFGVDRAMQSENTNIKNDSMELIKSADKGTIVEVSPNPAFSQAVAISRIKIADGYSSIMYEIDKIKKLFEPIQSFIAEVENDLNNDSK